MPRATTRRTTCPQDPERFIRASRRCVVAEPRPCATITRARALAPRVLRRVLGLAAAICAAGACAQEPAVAQERQDTEPRASIVAPPDIPWHTISWIERRYKIEALRFKAL